MDGLLQRVASQTMTFAIRSGIGVVSGFAMKKGAEYIRTLNGKDRKELMDEYARLDAKIKIISPAIDLVELVAARGNTALESAITLTKSLRADLQELGVRFSNALSGHPKHKFRSEPKDLMKQIREMILRLEDAVPLISLALNTSGVDLSTALPDSVSPSRLLQASTLVTAGDSAYVSSKCTKAQVGMNFTLTLYMLFAGHAHRKESLSASDLTWQEVIRKCRLRLERVPLHKYLYGEDDSEEEKEAAMRDENRANEFCYELVIIEDLDDWLAHDDEELEANGMGGPFEGVERAGIRTRIPIHQVGKIFYTSSGKLLGIDESSSPILLVNRQINAVPPRKLEEHIHRTQFDEEEEDAANGLANQTAISLNLPSGQPPHHNKQDLPSGLDPEWLAFEIYTENRNNSESDFEDEYDDDTSASRAGRRSSLSSSPPDMSSLSIEPPQSTTTMTFNNLSVKSHLSLLESIIRLLSLQTTIQASHLSAHDELLNLFLTNASGNLNSTYRTRADEREAARRKIGFDPFMDSPRGGRRPSQQNKNSLPPGRRTGYANDEESFADEYEEDVALPRMPPAGMQSSPVPGAAQGKARLMGNVRDNGVSSMPISPPGGGRAKAWEGRR